MNDIKEIMGQMRETPSPRCWESIASKLPTAGVSSGASAAASKTASAAGKAGATIAKTSLSAGKIVAIIASSTAIVTTATIITVSQLKPTPTSSDVTSTEYFADNSNMIAADTVNAETEDMQIAETSADKQTTSSIEYSKSENTSHYQISSSEHKNNSTIPSATNLQQSYTTPSQIQTSASQANPSASSTSSSKSVNQKTDTQTQATDQIASMPKTGQTRPETNNTGSENKKSDEYYSEDDYFAPAVKIEIPNIFTPNGDGVNDLFTINGIENCSKRTLVVKDKSGQIVFQSNQYENNWDGGNLPDGQYFYFFNYSINNISEFRRGTLYIRR